MSTFEGVQLIMKPTQPVGAAMAVNSGETLDQAAERLRAEDAARACPSKRPFLPPAPPLAVPDTPPDLSLPLLEACARLRALSAAIEPAEYTPQTQPTYLRTSMQRSELIRRWHVLSLQIAKSFAEGLLSENVEIEMNRVLMAEQRNERNPKDGRNVQTQRLNETRHAFSNAVLALFKK